MIVAEQDLQAIENHAASQPHERETQITLVGEKRVGTNTGEQTKQTGSRVETPTTKKKKKTRQEEKYKGEGRQPGIHSGDHNKAS